MAVAFRKLQSASSSSAGARLDVARSEYQATEKRVGEVEKARVTAILADTNDVARKLDGEVEALQRDFRIQRDRVKLLEDEVAREANDRRNQEIEAQNKQVDALFDQRDEAIGKLAACMKQEVKLWRQVLDANRKIVAAHSWSAADLSACMLSPLAVGSALSFESYRQSYTPRKFGGQVESADAGLSLPGSRSPKLEWLEWPERIVPLQDIFHEAGEYGKQVLRGKRPTARLTCPCRS